jgi:5-methylcytosine-specific restriction endonuclease McrA
MMAKQTKACEGCGMSNKWKGKPITLHTHHRDGDNSNDDPANLAKLCPNCHSQTDDYAGKGKNKHKGKFHKIIIEILV